MNTWKEDEYEAALDAMRDEWYAYLDAQRESAECDREEEEA